MYVHNSMSYTILTLDRTKTHPRGHGREQNKANAFFCMLICPNERRHVLRINNNGANAGPIRVLFDLKFCACVTYTYYISSYIPVDVQFMNERKCV